jgi:ATP-binding cassette subfamily B protein
MEDGAIVEQGSHDELLEAKGAYWRLYNAQFEAAIDDEEARVPVMAGAPPVPTVTELIAEAEGGFEGED